MSASEATRFVTAVEADKALSDRIIALGNDSAAVHAAVGAAGFDCTPDEIKAAFLEAHGAKLTPEQLDAIAGGLSDEEAGLIAVGVIGVVQAAAFAAAF